MSGCSVVSKHDLSLIMGSQQFWGDVGNKKVFVAGSNDLGQVPFVRVT